MKITSDLIDTLVARIGADNMVDLPNDDMDFSERFQAVVGQTVLLTVGLHQNSSASVWQLEVAELGAAWYAESESLLPSRDYKFSAGFTSFEAAMSALCDVTRLLSERDGFSEV